MKKFLTILGIISLLAIIGAVGLAVAADQTTAPPKTLDIACVKTAVDKRETAIQGALDTYYNAVKAALQARQTALDAAWGMNDKTQRQAAIKAAWSTFTASQKSAQKAFRQTKNSAWQQFTKDRVACKASPTGENSALDVSF